MKAGDEEEIEDNIDDKFRAADQQRDIWLVECTGAARDCDFEGGGDRLDAGDADVGQRGSADGFRNPGCGDAVGGADEDECHEEAKEGLNGDESVGERESGGESAICFVADEEPSCTKKALIEDFGDDANVGVDVCGDDLRGVDLGDPELGERTIQRGKGEGEEVEGEGSGIC